MRVKFHQDKVVCHKDRWFIQSLFYVVCLGSFFRSEVTFYSLPLSLSIVGNLGPVHKNQNIFFKPHPFYPEVHDSHHNSFDLFYMKEVSVLGENYMRPGRTQAGTNL